MKLANEFSRLLTEYLGAETIADINWLNETCPIPQICASHDFCDANEIMWDAWHNVYGSDFNGQSNEHKSKWNEAWVIAKNNKFSYEQEKV